jgi:hypothetical protein
MAKMSIIIAPLSSKGIALKETMSKICPCSMEADLLHCGQYIVLRGLRHAALW